MRLKLLHENEHLRLISRTHEPFCAEYIELTGFSLHYHVDSGLLCSHRVRRDAVVQTAVSKNQVFNG